MSEKTPTTKRPITLDDINAIDYIDQYKKIEVVNGDWNCADVPFYRAHGMLSGVIGANIMGILYTFVKEHDIGRVYAGSVGYVMDGDRENIRLMRRTDISFVKKENLRLDKEDEPYYQAPDLAVEVVYQDYADDMFERIHDFLTHGTVQVWVVAPSAQTLLVFYPDDTVRLYRPGQTIPGGDLLPGFTLDVSTIFET